MKACIGIKKKNSYNKKELKNFTFRFKHIFWEMSEDKNLRKAGLKVTLPRVRILEILNNHPKDLKCWRMFTKKLEKLEMKLA